MKTYRIWLDSKGRVRHTTGLFVDVKAESAKIALNIFRQVLGAGIPQVEELTEKPAPQRTQLRVPRGDKGDE